MYSEADGVCQGLDQALGAGWGGEQKSLFLELSGFLLSLLQKTS